MAETIGFAPLQTITITPTAALVKRRFVGMAGTGYCAANAKALGVTDNEYDLEANKQGACVTSGFVFVEASAAIAVGDAVASTSTGKAVTGTAVTSTPASGATPVSSTGAQPPIVAAGGVLPQQINGHAFTASDADGDYILVKLC